MIVFQKGKETATIAPVDVETMLQRNSDQMFLLENEAIEFIRDTYIAYAGVNRAHDAIKANQAIDFEALAEKVEKKTKQKMVVVKEDCDSFDVMPLDVANAEGKRVLLSTRIDRFIASFSGGKDSQVVLDPYPQQPSRLYIPIPVMNCLLHSIFTRKCSIITESVSLRSNSQLPAITNK